MNRRNFVKKQLHSLIALLGASLLSNSGCEKINSNHRIIVVGAGIAGLAAAKYLKDKGLGVTVVEAQNVLGGRIRTNRSLNVPFDEGASWIHGPIGNPITSLGQDAGLTTFLTDDENVSVFDAAGTAYTDVALDNAETAFEQAVDAVRTGGNVTDSFKMIFDNLYPQHMNNDLWTYMLSAYLEFDTGADISQLSSIDFDDDSSYSGADEIVTNGFDTLINYMATDLDIHPNEEVTRIAYLEDTVTVTCSSGKNYYGDYVLLTLPLGVLKQGNIHFVPALPSVKQQAISNMQVGTVNKFLLEWDNAFWDTSLQYIGYTPQEKGKFNYFLNMNTFASGNFLMTFAFGDYAEATEQMSDQDIIQEIMNHLKAIYGNSIPNPKNMLRTKWKSNPMSYGSYSFAANGTRSTDFITLANKVNNKLFFAGEHTSRNYRGTVHGAYLSGIRAAEEIESLL